MIGGYWWGNFLRTAGGAKTILQRLSSTSVLLEQGLCPVGDHLVRGSGGGQRLARRGVEKIVVGLSVREHGRHGDAGAVVLKLPVIDKRCAGGDADGDLPLPT